MHTPEPLARSARTLLALLVLGGAPLLRADDSPSASSGSAAASAAPPGARPELLPEGWKPSLSLRARYELGDQSGRSKAHAATLRGRLGLATPRVAGFSAFGELESTQALDATSYQAASIEGTGRQLTVIADPESSEVNRLWIDHQSEWGTLKLGRQRIVLDDARFVGNVGWRQNEQTFDAVSFQGSPFERATLRYAYVWRVNRIFGSKHPSSFAHDDFDARVHLLDGSYALGGALGTLGAYGYFMELRNGPTSSASNNTLGVRWTGSTELAPEVALAYRLEHAVQREAGRSRLDYRARYLRGELSASRAKLTLGLGAELLDADDGVGFQTPLATQHKFNGFADVFLATPPQGLFDRYAWVSAPLPLELALRAEYHDYAQADSRGDLGREYDLVLSRPLPLGLTALAKYAVFTSEAPSLRDLRRLVLQLEYTL